MIIPFSRVPYLDCTRSMGAIRPIVRPSGVRGHFVDTGSIEKARWLRDLIRFLPLRSQFVLSGNVRDLQIHEPVAGEVTAAPLATILFDQLRKSGYQRIVTFDLVAGFRGFLASGTGSQGTEEPLRALGI